MLLFKKLFHSVRFKVPQNYATNDSAAILINKICKFEGALKLVVNTLRKIVSNVDYIL